jgi:hypothetical protein
MGWTTRRLTNELARVASPEAFIDRVMRALKEHDKPRLLHRISERGYTSIPQEAMNGEPEAIPAEYQAQITSDAWAGFSSARRKHNEARRDYDLPKRLQRLQRDARVRHVDISNGLRVIERQLERMEARVDRVNNTHA